MKMIYALGYFDHLISYELTPENMHSPTQDQQEQWIDKISIEKLKAQELIKKNVFAVQNEDHCAALVKKYYEAIVSLIDDTYLLTVHPEYENTTNQQIVEYALVTLEDLLRHLELHYRRYLDADIRVSQKDLIELKEEILLKSYSIPAKLLEDGNSQMLTDIVMTGIRKFVQRIDNQESITQKECTYHLGFINDLYNNTGRLKIIPECPSLHEIILFWNFNSREAISYLSNELEQLISDQPTQQAKIDFIRMHFIRLLHLPARPKTTYDVEFPGLKCYFTTLMTSLKEFHATAPLVPDQEHSDQQDTVEIQKVTIDLSADQIAIIIWVFIELRTLVGKSMRIIFETVVKYLSTPRKKDISWENMRIKSYNPEQRDLNVVIDLFERAVVLLRNR